MSFRDHMYPVSIIVATDIYGGFSKNGTIPWINEPFAKVDLKRFKQITSGNVCIMGRKTYQDMLDFRLKRTKKNDIKEILPGRESFVVTRNQRLKTPGATVVKSIRDAIYTMDSTDKREVFILGGERMFIEAMSWTQKVYMTIIDKAYDCDLFFPVNALNKFDIKSGEQQDNLKFLTYERVRW